VDSAGNAGARNAVRLAAAPEAVAPSALTPQRARP